MPNVKQPSSFCPDQESLGKPKAANGAERRRALRYTTETKWPAADIGRLERIDSLTENGWKMWRWQAES